MFEAAGCGDWPDCFGDEYFNHEGGDSPQKAVAYRPLQFIGVDKRTQLCAVKMVGPFGGVRPSSRDRELERTIGQIGDNRGHCGGVEVEYTGNLAFHKKHISGMPVPVDNLMGPFVETEAIDRIACVDV